MRERSLERFNRWRLWPGGDAEGVAVSPLGQLAIPDPTSESPCGFLAFDAAGAAFRFRLRFPGGPLEAPCVEVERCESEALPPAANSPGLNGVPLKGSSGDSLQGDAGPSCAALVQLPSRAWTAELRPY
ncbi:hypothetical protein AK812_SmicGene32530 [Symbiodinium microadriaticum]|uniref:Uncharacterized protein n=1 Tax=Symbiodinium microadriaticum TaxID=2951 RepID=A0A1Q9CU16_SYMMI|nr:hypothetical protein AK812_SmicGene32530 [Symbiodinium microadriaticum]